MRVKAGSGQFFRNASFRFSVLVAAGRGGRIPLDFPERMALMDPMETIPPRSRINADLAAAYDRMAHLRDVDRYEAWKRTERRAFAVALQKEGKQRLLEIGAGTGRDALWFQENGMVVTCVDLSPRMVEVCRRKGLDARVMDFLQPEFEDAPFDAIFSLNALVHVGSAEYRPALETLKTLVHPGGLLYLGQYGGSNFEGVLEKDNYRPRRFFYFPDLPTLKSHIDGLYAIEREETVEIPGRDYVFYSLILRAD